MNYDEKNQKLKAERAYIDQAGTTLGSGALRGIAQDMCPARPHWSEILASREKRSGDELRKVTRLRELIEKHPEFPELLEFIRLNNDLYIFE